MASTPLAEVEEVRLVIAIDYGTTYTGVAIATPVGNRANLDAIDIVLDWGPGQGSYEKIPSVISYTLPGPAREQQWGAVLSSDAIAMVHTKLQLDVFDESEELDLILQALDGMHDLDFQYIKDSGSEPNFTWKKPEEIVEDYLTRIFDHLLQTVDNFSETFRKGTPVDIVATVPAEWGYRAKNSTFRALTGAGFNKDTFPRLQQMLLVSEPEAAAIYTARFLKEEYGADFLRLSECFVLCDAGGGTVDVVSYKVKQLRPTFEIERVTLPSGDKCGSIFINLAFKEWLRALLGERMYQELDQAQPVYKISSHNAEGERMRKLMDNFDSKKRAFPRNRNPIKITLPEPYQNLNLDTRVIGGEIKIPYETMASFFEPRVDRIVELIHGQVLQIQMERRTTLKNVFLVGGFAESKYLQESLRESLEMRRLELRIPDTSWTAVVRGACMFGIEKPVTQTLSSMTACPRSYGIAVNLPFSEINSDARDKVTDNLTGVSMAREQLIWLIKKGDLILSDLPKIPKATFTKTFTENGPRDIEIPIYSSEEDPPQERLRISEADLHTPHTLRYDLQNIPLEDFERSNLVPGPTGTLQYFWKADLTVSMQIVDDTLQVKLLFRERILDSVDISSPEPVTDDLGLDSDSVL